MKLVKAIQNSCELLPKEFHVGGLYPQQQAVNIFGTQTADSY